MWEVSQLLKMVITTEDFMFEDRLFHKWYCIFFVCCKANSEKPTSATMLNEKAGLLLTIPVFS